MLFGHQNDDTALAPPPAPPTPAAGVNPLAVDPATGVSLPVPPTATPIDEPDEPSILNQPTPVPSAPALADSVMTFPPLATPKPNIVSRPNLAITPEPAQPEVSQPEPEEPEEVDEPDLPEPTPEVTDDTDNDVAAPAASDVSSDDLLNLKAKALTQLSPLVDQLDQTPEEKFRTTMMFIQSTDDPGRIPAAYAAAQAIQDEKIRAQALLDIINEINYFTQTRPATVTE